jgi:hypothetical protein
MSYLVLGSFADYTNWPRLKNILLKLTFYSLLPILFRLVKTREEIPDDILNRGFIHKEI